MRLRVNSFLDEVVWHQPWFTALHENQAWDLFVLAGSHARGDAHVESDVDLFLVLPHAAQRTYQIPAVHEYEFDGHLFEISKITTEKLKLSTDDKRNLFWWYRTHLVRSNNQDAENWHRLASMHTDEEIRDLLWNSFCLFEIEYENNLPACALVEDELGVHLCFANCLRYALDIALIARGDFMSMKQKGRTLRRHRPDVYDQLLRATRHSSVEQKISDLQIIREKMIADLMTYGFSISEISAWHQHHVERFLHQAK